MPAASVQRRRTSRRHACALLALLCGSALGTPNAAAEANRRVLLIERGRDSLLERVGSEIAALGFFLVRRDTDAALEEAARTAHAAAALRVLPARNGVEVWMADETSGRSLLRQIIVDESPDGPDRDLIALQTAELLRTSLLGVKPAKTAAQCEPSAQSDAGAPATNITATPSQRGGQAPRAADETKRAVQPTDDSNSATTQESAAVAATDDAFSPALGVQLACGPFYAWGGAGPALELGVSAQYFVSPHLGLAIDFAMPLAAARLNAIEGSAALGSYFVGAAVMTQLTQPGSAWFATAGVAAAALLVTYDGETRAPLQASSGKKLTAAAYLRGEFGRQLVGWMRLGVRVLAGASAERVGVMFAGNGAGSFGPLLLAGLVFGEVSVL